MSTAHSRWRPGRAVARSLGSGACWGALFGVMALAIFVLAVGLATGRPAILAAILFFGPYAAVVGSVIGMACGMVACVPMLLVGYADRRHGRSTRARHHRASLAGSGGAALLPAVLGVVTAVRGPESWAWAWLCVTAIAAIAGMALGPCVLYGRRIRARPARDRGRSNATGHASQASAG